MTPRLSVPVPDPPTDPPAAGTVPLPVAHTWVEPVRWMLVGTSIVLVLLLLVAAVVLAVRHRAPEPPEPDSPVRIPT